MTRPILPSRYVNTDPRVIFHSKLPDGAKVFYDQLRALAWQTNYKSTSWLSMSELEGITGRKRTAIYGYMRSLDLIAALSWRTSNDKRFMFTFPDSAKSAHADSPSLTTTSESQSIDSERGVEGVRKSVNADMRTRSLPQTPAEAERHPDIRVFQAICDRIPGIGQYAVVIDTVGLMRGRFSEEDALVEAAKPYWLAWKSRQRTDGRPYDESNLAWFTEWFVNGKIPPARGNGKKLVETEFVRDPDWQADYEEKKKRMREVYLLTKPVSEGGKNAAND